MDLSEAQIEKQICDYLSLKHYFFWKQPSSGFFDTKIRQFRKHASPFVRSGVPDIILIHLGTFIGLEVKSKKGRQSEEQIAFQHDLQRAGGKYFLVRSLEDVQDILKQL